MSSAAALPRAGTHDETDAFVADNYAELKVRKVLAAGVPLDGARTVDAHAPGGDRGVAMEKPEGRGTEAARDLAIEAAKRRRDDPLQEKPQTVLAGRFAFGLPLDE